MMKALFTLFLYVSTISFWYMTLTEHQLLFILSVPIWTLIAIFIFVITFYIVNIIVRILRKRYRWARRVFSYPSRY